eukprot:5063793-Pleurochrysis_carterae.AAC.2
MTTHAFTWRVPCKCLLLGVCLERLSGAGREMANSFNANSHRSGSDAGAGAGRTYGAAPVRGSQRAAAAMRKRGFQSLGNGARALRKCAFDANANLETVHTSVKLRRKATVSGIEPNERAKR